MSDPVSFDDYLASLRRLTPYVDPTTPTPASEDLHSAVADLESLDLISVESLTDWVNLHPRWANVLGLAVGLSQEQLKNSLKSSLGSSGWITLARKRPADLVNFFEEEFELVRALESQRGRTYGFADILVARAGSRVTAARSQSAGRMVEDRITDIATDLGLPYVARSSFVGRDGDNKPADLIVPSVADAQIVVAAKGFDSTGSKLTDAYREIADVANHRFAHQYVFAIVDGIGWHSRLADLRRIHELWVSKRINGMYTLSSLDQFRADLHDAAHRAKLI
ncbi:hypothetical protein [Mycobacteroides chelonae]|uniref:hypothetical protein n=1 Tax=Mycobacteroides chelonae TaxID=1774 RepID=UPI003AAB2C17